MAKDVLCEVNTCRHWGDGNQCQADKIYIISHSSHEKAQSSAETDCKTFEAK